MVDMNVAKIAYSVARSMAATDKVILALFEAGLVESNFTNHKTATDHDSLGYLQQRPSAGWPNPTNVSTATRSFVSKALTKERKGQTAGQLAQAVQVSAYPDRYDQREAEAQALIKKVSGSNLNVEAEPAGLSDAKEISKIPYKIAMISAGLGLVAIALIAIVRGQSVKATVAPAGKIYRKAKAEVKSANRARVASAAKAAATDVAKEAT